MQVLRSIEAHSAVSLEQSDPQQLMMRLLLLSIQIDRKDTIIRQLMQLASGEEQRRIVQEFTLRCNKYEMEIKTLTETIYMLKQNISSIQNTKNREVFTSITQFNEQLENKVLLLEGKLRRTQQQKIDLQEQVKQNKVNQSLAEFNFFKNQHNEKSKVRELQTLLASERVRAENERKSNFQKNILIDELKSKIVQFENRQKLIIGQYQEKLRTFHSQYVFHDNLKKSQIINTEERLSATSQQLAAFQDQIRYLKQTNQNLRETVQNKQKEFTKISIDIKTIQTKLFKTESDLRETNIRLQTKTQEIKMKDKQLSEKSSIAHALTSELDEIRFTFATKGQETQLYSDQVQKLKSQLTNLHTQLQTQRMEIRKLKRKPVTQATLCQGCRAREIGSSSQISSQKSIKGLNIGDIIEQTEQLFRSNRKIQSLINRHELVAESSIHVYQNHNIDM